MEIKMTENEFYGMCIMCLLAISLILALASVNAQATTLDTNVSVDCCNSSFVFIDGLPYRHTSCRACNEINGSI